MEKELNIFSTIGQISCIFPFIDLIKVSSSHIFLSLEVNLWVRTKERVLTSIFVGIYLKKKLGKQGKGTKPLEMKSTTMLLSALFYQC